MEGGSSSQSTAAASGGGGFSALPEGCIADVLALTSPQDVCKMSMVASAFQSAAESDGLWERLLPSDYQEIIGRSSESSSRRNFSSKKELFFSLCNSPLLIDGGRKSFWLEKRSGKKCYMLSAEELSITWDENPQYCSRIFLPELSRFKEVVLLNNVCWFRIKGNINTCTLSPKTNYAAYLISNAVESGFEDVPMKSSVGVVGGETTTKTIYLGKYGILSELELAYDFVSIENVKNWVSDSLTQLYSLHEPGKLLSYEDVRNWMNNDLTRLRCHKQLGVFRDGDISYPEEGQLPIFGNGDSSYPKERKDGWFEIELGEFYNDGEEDMELEISVVEVERDNWKNDVIIEGVEIRPKRDI